MTRCIAIAPLTMQEPSPPGIVSFAARAAYSRVGMRLVPAARND